MEGGLGGGGARPRRCAVTADGSLVGQTGAQHDTTGTGRRPRKPRLKVAHGTGRQPWWSDKEWIKWMESSLKLKTEPCRGINCNVQFK